MCSWQCANHTHAVGVPGQLQTVCVWTNVRAELLLGVGTAADTSVCIGRSTVAIAVLLLPCKRVDWERAFVAALEAEWRAPLHAAQERQHGWQDANAGRAQGLDGAGGHRAVREAGQHR